jgi:hypothetical protein
MWSVCNSVVYLCVYEQMPIFFNSYDASSRTLWNVCTVIQGSRLRIRVKKPHLNKHTLNFYHTTRRHIPEDINLHRTWTYYCLLGSNSDARKAHCKACRVQLLVLSNGSHADICTWLWLDDRNSVMICYSTLIGLWCRHSWMISNLPLSL